MSDDVKNFEDRLLLELRSLVPPPSAGRGQQRPPWRRPRFVFAGGLTAVLATATTAGVVLLSAGTQAAYAVTKNADGTVTVEIDSLSDAAGLQAKLRAVGVNAVVQYLPEGKACRQPWFTPLGRPVSGGSTGGVSTRSGVAQPGSGDVTFTISADIPSDATVVISTQTGPGREQALGVGYAKGDVPPCDVVDAPAGSGPLGGPPPGAETQAGQG
jgi:hypothetical protein